MNAPQPANSTDSEKNAEAFAAFDSFLETIEKPSAEVHAFLESHLKPRFIKKKTVFWPAGVQSKYVYFVVSGLVRGYYTQPDGTEVTGWLAEANELICIPASLFTGATCEDCLETLQDSQVIEIPYGVLQAGCERFVYFCRLMRSLLQHTVLKQDERCRLLRVSNVQERLDLFISSSPNLYMSIPACVTASYLGISKTSMNRMRSVFAQTVRLGSVQQRSA